MLKQPRLTWSKIVLIALFLFYLLVLTPVVILRPDLANQARLIALIALFVASILWFSPAVIRIFIDRPSELD
jgi:hypothetical protein